MLPTNNPQATSPQTLKNTQQNPCLMVGFFWNKALKPRLQITLGQRMQVHSGQVTRLPSSPCQAQGCGSPSQEEAGRGPSLLCLPAWGSPPIGGLWAQGVEGQPVWIHSQNVLSVSSQGCCSCGGRRLSLCRGNLRLVHPQALGLGEPLALHLPQASCAL